MMAPAIFLLIYDDNNSIKPLLMSWVVLGAIKSCPNGSAGAAITLNSSKTGKWN